MQNMMEQLSDFYIVDSSTVMLIALFCAWAAYFVRQRIANVNFLVILYPLFVLISATALSAAIHMELLSLRKTSDWIIFSVSASAFGATTGITLVAILRRLVDFVTMRSHIRASVRRDEEDAAKGYERMHL